MILSYYITLDSAAAAAAPDPPAAVRQLPQGRAHDQAPQTAPGQQEKCDDFHKNVVRMSSDW